MIWHERLTAVARCCHRSVRLFLDNTVLMPIDDIERNQPLELLSLTFAYKARLFAGGEQCLVQNFEHSRQAMLSSRFFRRYG